MKLAAFAMFARTLPILFTTAAATAQSDQLILESPGGALAVTPPRHTRDVERVGVDFELLSSLRADDGFAMTIYGDDLIAIVDEVKPQVEGFTIRGHFDRSFRSFFTITVVGDAAAGSFHIPGAHDMVRLRYGGPGGLHYLHRIEIGPEDECAGEAIIAFEPGEVREIDRMNFDRRLDQVQGPPNSPVLGGCSAPDPTFDVMLIYSDDARAAAGGANAIRAECIDAVEVMELTYLSCSVLIRTNIVYLAEVSYDERDRSYRNHLDSLIDPDDGILDGIHSTRNSVEADFVSLIVADDESGGLGRCWSSAADAMSVCNWTVMADNFTLAHEVGHNIGCAHNPEDAESCEPTEYGYGHNFYVPDEDMWRHSVMAYSRNGSTRIPYYSSPDCEYEGVPTGTPERDNLAVILLRQYTVEAFRRTRMDVWVDFGHGGTENGSYSQPYNTVIEGVNRTLPNPVADIPVLHIKSGSRAETITISKPMIIKACGGTVTIG
jgi:hypothetical protein